MNTTVRETISKALQSFVSADLSASALHLFTVLGYNTDRQAALAKPTYKEFKEEFVSTGTSFNEGKAFVHDWTYVNILFQLSSQEMQQMEDMFKPTFNRNEPASYLFFIIELKGTGYSRNQLAQIAREINKLFPMHVFVLFKYNHSLTLSLIDRRQNKKIPDRDVLETVTHIFNISFEKPHAAHIQILYSLSFEAIGAEARKKRIETFADLQNGWRKVISTEILNKQFYLDYQELSTLLIKAIHPKQAKNKLAAHQGVLNLLNRIMFIYFVQKKEWIMGDENFIIHFWNAYQETKKKDLFHEEWLNTIFFTAFNGIAFRSPKALKALPEPYKGAIITFPYLNGGLFTRSEEYDDFILEDKYFEKIFAFFEGYIFTITEDTPYDVNLEINPELLGKMYEGMINATDLDDVDAENGIIYTERPEINFMTRRSLVEVLDKKLDGSLSREFLYHFVFDEPDQKTEALKHYKADLKTLREAVTSITVCDPACGSGSMLLGMIQLQMELIRVLDRLAKRTHTPKDDFSIKKQLISDCIYGVDVKEWAVRIAELRLWLYMIAESEFEKEELTATPLLPNLDFKLRQGNSLLQKFGSLDFTLKDLFKGRNKSAGATRKLHEFVKKKKEFIVNQSESKTTFGNLKKEEQSVFLKFIDELTIEKTKFIQERRAKTGEQSGMFGVDRPSAELRIEKEIEDLKKEIEELKELKRTILKTDRLPFSYDIDFMEVFMTSEDPGFDLVIGNPPYVRQEQILPPEDGEYLEYLLKPENKNEKAEQNKAYKELLSEKVFKTYPFLNASIKTVVDEKSKIVFVYGTKVPGRSDLFSYFQLLCPSYLNSKGTFCFIISNAWLDVDFGSFVQQFLLKHTRLYAIYDCTIRSFDAKINTIIYIHSALQNLPRATGAVGGFTRVEPVSGAVQFVMNKIDFALASYAPVLVEQEHCHSNSFTDLYRVITLTQPDLYLAGYDEESVEYIGDKWGGKYLRAPEIYYTILEKGKNALVKLGDVSTINRGITTGANEFFYLDREDQSKWNIEKEYLVPVFKGPKDSRSIHINKNGLKLGLFYCHKGKTDLKGTNALKYILWGERNEFHKRPSCRGRSLWYDIGERDNALGIFPKGFGDIFRVFENSGVVADCRLYEIYSKEKDLILSMNSTLFILFLEVSARKGLGEGLMEFFVYELPHFMVPLINGSKFKSKEFLKREIKDIQTEMGFNKLVPIRSQRPNPLPDRKELDDMVFDEIGLTHDERREVYWCVGELVRQRLDKAASR